MSVNIDTNIKQFTFKAWVEAQPSKEAGNGKLHVHGEIEVADEKLFYQLDKKELQGYFHEELLLVIKPDPTPGNHKVELKYHEDLQSENEYTRISIIANNEQIAEIKEIGKS